MPLTQTKNVAAQNAKQQQANTCDHIGVQKVGVVAQGSTRIFQQNATAKRHNG